MLKLAINYLANYHSPCRLILWLIYRNEDVTDKGNHLRPVFSHVDPETHRKVTERLKKDGVKISEFIRRALIAAAESGENELPFSEYATSIRAGRPWPKREKGGEPRTE